MSRGWEAVHDQRVADQGAERPRTGTRGMAGAAGALVALGVALGVVVALTTPWDALRGITPEDPARDFTAAQIARGTAFDAATSLPGYLSLAITLIIAGL